MDEMSFSRSNSLTTLELDLSNKSLKLIDDNAFNDFSNLRRLLLSSNLLLTLPDRVFANLNRLTTLDLSFNRLQMLNEAHFAQLVDLRLLFLNNNRLISIDAKAFASFGRLNQLHLNDNLLSFTSSESLFASMSNLTYLNLASNDLRKSLTNQNLLNGLVSLREINMNMCSLLNENVNLRIFESLPRLEKVYFQNNSLSNKREFETIYTNVTFIF